MSTIIRNNAKIVATCGQRLTALKKFVKTKTAMTVSGDQIKVADLIAIYQAAIDTRSDLVPVRAAFETALAARDGAEVTRQETDKKLKAWVVNEFGPSSTEATEFGFAPTKVRAASSETRATAAKLGMATRVARGTKGKRQKEKIKGTLVPAAPAVPAIPATVAAPAPVALTATNAAPAGAVSSNGVGASS